MTWLSGIMRRILTDRRARRSLGTLAEFGEPVTITRHMHLVKQPECKLPPEGWYCTRGAGHDGPCAAWPEDESLIPTDLNTPESKAAIEEISR